jgi:hypothetical protein
MVAKALYLDFSRQSFEQPLENLGRLRAQGRYQSAELDHIDPTFAPLDIRDEGLRPSNSPRQFNLGHVRLSATG